MIFGMSDTWLSLKVEVFYCDFLWVLARILFKVLGSM